MRFISEGTDHEHRIRDRALRERRNRAKKDDYSDYYGCGGYAIRGPEDEQLAGRLDALLEKGDYPAIDRLLENADRTERDHATAIYKRVLERRNRLAEMRRPCARRHRRDRRTLPVYGSRMGLERHRSA
jgi:hypothetical protein